MTAAPALALLWRVLLVHPARKIERPCVGNFVPLPCAPAVKRTPPHPTETTKYWRTKEQWKIAVLKKNFVFETVNLSGKLFHLISTHCHRREFKQTVSSVLFLTKALVHETLKEIYTMATRDSTHS